MPKRLPRLNKDSPVPYYQQIKEILEQAIQQGIFKPGDAIPPEGALQKHFDVSRATLRQAVDALVAAGLLQKRRGIGTFVAAPKIAELLSNLVSFSEEMRLKGLTPGTAHIEVAWEVPADPIAAALQLEPGEKVLRIKRLRTANGEPVVVLTSYVPAWTGISLQDDFSGSLIALLEDKYGVEYASADQTIEAAGADADTAKLLGVAEGDPILVIRRVTRTAAHVPVEYVEGLYRADRYSYRIRLNRQKPILGPNGPQGPNEAI